ncbi:prolipoprotein diacylglyceryl transferase [Mycoplasma sp. 1018B]|uniref:prolipoprotein diacylglyceryl transferase n=1 Tax=Mycoplasma sp. 1018B TaxID=2967302 RepID=UPI00211CC1BF|nr:prolipoprotein diacylglyceryl transferase [Mycoplasma sp. 1018B]UUM19133.1 prolipoprotein diacylglyceryl transferase [Mycoplasma sp. 1018B]
MNNLADVFFRPGEGGILLEIGSFSLRTYSLTLFLGILASIFTISIFWKRQNYKFEYLSTLILITIPTAIIGARLWDLVEEAINPQSNFDFSRWYAIWEGGLSIQGGVVLAFLCDFIYVYTKRDVIDIRKTASMIIPTILIGQVIGRWGNYANHELYGKVDWDGSSVLIFGKNFAQNLFISDAVSDSLNVSALYRYPLFLYESLANLVGYLIIVWVINWLGLLKPGSSAGLYFIWYGLVRMAMEPLRENSFNIYVFASIGFVIAGLIALIYFEFISKVHYLKIRKKYYFDYVYAHKQIYVDHINKTRFFKTKRTKEKLTINTLRG